MNAFHDTFPHLLTEPPVLVKIPVICDKHNNGPWTPILLFKELEPDTKGWVAWRRLIEDQPRAEDKDSDPCQEKKP